MTLLRKPLLLALAVATLAVLSWRLPVEDWNVSPIATVALGAVLLCALVPRTAISLACGALFGAWAGAAFSLTAAVIAASITFAAGAWAGRELLPAKAGRRLKALDAWLARRGVLAVVVVRLLPIAPFGLVGYAYGASSTRFRHFLTGTALGGVPSSISYATIGAAAMAPGTMNWLTFLPAAIGLILTTGAALYWRRSSTSDRPAIEVSAG
jgi:uncharacterized membrane protein YdjX (TVP38/TMEM64 family)